MPGNLWLVLDLDAKKRGTMEEQLVALAERLCAEGIRVTMVFARPPAAFPGGVLRRLGGQHVPGQLPGVGDPDERMGEQLLVGVPRVVAQQRAAEQRADVVVAGHQPDRNADQLHAAHRTGLSVRERLVDRGERRVALRRTAHVEVHHHRDEAIPEQALFAEQCSVVRQAAQFDRQYATTFTGTQPNHFSPFALSVRATPTNDINATVRAEFDSRYKSLRTISASGTYAWSSRIQSTIGWSKKAFIEKLNGFNDPRFLDHYVNTSTSIHTQDNRVGGVYTFNYDVLRSTMLNQRVTGFYNAQCCGIAIEYMTYNFAGTSVPVPADHRFFISFTLAGLGNFSPLNGALSGVPR